MITPEVIVYIRTQLKAGVAQEEIRKLLTAQGWQLQDLDEAFATIPEASITQTVVQNAILPIRTQGHFGKWVFAIISVLIVGVGGASVAYFYVESVSPTPSQTSLSTATDTSATLTAESQVADNVVVTNHNSLNPETVLQGAGSIATTTHASSTPPIKAHVVKPASGTITTTGSPTGTEVNSITSTQETNSPTKTAEYIDIFGRAQKGRILHARIRATEVIDGKKNGVTKEVEIGASGDFSISMPKAVILLEVVTRNGSIEEDEALGVDVPLPLDFRFRAGVDLVDTSIDTKSIRINITAYSEAAVVVAEKAGGLSQRNINIANSGIANILGVDFLSTEMISSKDNVRLASATQAEKKMAILNAAISVMASTDKMGCGAMPTYGEIINCTIAKFADEFVLQNN